MNVGRRVARIFKGGSRFFIKRAEQAASEASVAYVRLCVFLEVESLVGSGVKPRETFHFLVFESLRLRENWHPECSVFSLWIFPIQSRLLWLLKRLLYGDTFVATNFLISLFLFFPLYDFNLILLASQRAPQRASLAKGYTPAADRDELDFRTNWSSSQTRINYRGFFFHYMTGN